MVSIFFAKTVFLDVLKMKLAEKLARLEVVGSHHVVLAGFGGIQNSEFKTNALMDIAPARWITHHNSIHMEKMHPAKWVTWPG